MAYITTATIFGNKPEIFQSNIVQYEYMFTGAKNIVTYCFCQIPLRIKATDLEEDIRVAIAEDLNCEPHNVEITSDIDFPVPFL